MKKRKLTGPEPATSRPIAADPLAAEPRSPPTSIDPFLAVALAQLLRDRL